MRMRLLLVLALLAGAAAAHQGLAGRPDTLRVGVGRADITPPTGYYSFGWVRSDAVLRGVHTRIQARAIVLQRGKQKLALVSEDLGAIAGGVVHEAAKRLAARGFGDSNIVVSASHTHAGPTGYFPYSTYNTVFMTKDTLTKQNVAGTLDPQLYAFEVRQLVLAITRADQDLGPGRLGWATEKLLGLTANRSIEAHLRNHGVVKDYGSGKVADDPKGYADTIDPEVQVLRVDKRVGGRMRPVGMWSTFADHGTVNKFQFGVYNADHHGSASRLVEERLRALGAVPRSQDVVNAYGNTDEGDQSAGLTRSGPAAADAVGRVEAAAMLRAWASAGRHLTSTPALRTRWTRVCFCGSQTRGGPVASSATPGLPFLTGSEEGRGPLYDVTHVPFEGKASPVDYPLDPAQGHKIGVPTGALSPGSTPTAVPLMVAQVGERLVATIPGEMTVGMGRLVRGAVALTAGPGIKGVQLSGLANEYMSYFTTPQEYDAQHYEGGSMMYGREASVFLMEQLQLLTRALVTGRPAPPPYAEDPTNGVSATAPPFPTGSRAGALTSRPRTTQRLARASVTWQGGPWGQDMPLGRAFVSVERLGHGRYADDLGLQVLWRVDDDKGHYTAEWEVPRYAPRGAYRFVITANHYRLVSAPFTVVPATTLSVVGRSVRYPQPVENVDLTWRPLLADGARLSVYGGIVPPGGARDRWGNCNGAPATTDGKHSGADAGVNPAVCG
jgi:hypothetical protein